MSTNKHQFIRYQALDKCFANKGRRYFIDDLIKACNTALYEYTGDPMYNGSMPAVSRRTLYNDIDFMKSEKGWSAPIKRGIINRKAYTNMRTVTLLSIINLFRKMKWSTLKRQH
jgi:hypothetical protein